MAKAFYHTRLSNWLVTSLVLGVCLCLASCQGLGDDSRHPVVSYNSDGAEKWGYITEGGKLAIPCEFNSASSFSNNRAIVTVAGGEKYQYAIIDPDGNTIRLMDPDVAIVHPYQDGLARANVGGKRTFHSQISGGLWGYLDEDGDWQIPPTISIDSSKGDSQMYGIFLFSGGDFREGRAMSQDTDGWVFIDTNGRIVSDSYYYLSPFKNGVTEVAKGNLEDVEWIYINRQGKVLWPPTPASQK